MIADLLKTSEALSVLCLLNGGGVLGSRLMSLLYLCERESWKTRRMPLLGTSIVFTRGLGPVHASAQQVLGTPKGVHTLFRRLTNDDEKLIKHVVEVHGSVTTSQIIQNNFALPECRSALQARDTSTIPHALILKALGFNSEEIWRLFEGRRQLKDEWVESCQRTGYWDIPLSKSSPLVGFAASSTSNSSENVEPRLGQTEMPRLHVPLASHAAADAELALPQVSD